VLIAKYLDNAIECEVDALSDGQDIFIPAIMQHVEPAGVHSGDANISLPAHALPAAVKATIAEYTKRISSALGTIGLLNMQYAVRHGIVYVLEANPRASRTVPFVSKATGFKMANAATKILVGRKLAELKPVSRQESYSVKSVVFPFLKLMGADMRLGPEMKSTGESMGLGNSFEIAYYKALLGAGIKVNTEQGPPGSPGRGVFISLKDEDKVYSQPLGALLADLGFSVYGTEGTVGHIPNATTVHKLGRGKPDVLDTINSGKIALVINTPTAGGKSHTDGFKIRRAAIERNLPCIVNIHSAFELLHALVKLRSGQLEVRRLEEYWSRP
jgi:carbamoyl-phosphate synthase large subunit